LFRKRDSIKEMGLISNRVWGVLAILLDVSHDYTAADLRRGDYDHLTVIVFESDLYAPTSISNAGNRTEAWLGVCIYKRPKKAV
jgi:hypothetical protein